MSGAVIRVECRDCGWSHEGNIYPADERARKHRRKFNHDVAPVEVTHTGQHDRWKCSDCHTIQRRNTLLHRALHNPAGLTPYAFTKGMTKADALMFWVDAKALGFKVVGVSPRGAKVLALPSTEEKAS